MADDASPLPRPHAVGPARGSTSIGEASASSTGEPLGAGVERLAGSLRAAFEESARVRDEVRRVRASARYRLGALILDAARPSRQVLSLPRQLLALYRGRENSTQSEGAARPSEQDDARFDARLAEFARRSAEGSSAWVVFSFTGTRLGGIRASRPFAMARVLEARGAPILFGHAGPSQANARADCVLELPESFLARRLEAIARLDFGARKRLFVTSYPTPEVALAINAFNAAGWVTVYDALDDWEAFTQAGVGTWFSAAAERYVARNADLTTAVSAPLAAKLEPSAQRIALSPNALDPAFVPSGWSRRPATPPRVGYFGHLTPAWFDWESLTAIARARPAYTFEIIGHDAPRGLRLPENVRLLGPKPPSEIPAIARLWSAAIIPFRVGPLSAAVDPIKIYEYLALGLPTVSFTMPQIASYPGTTTVGDVDAFVTALDRALATSLDRALATSLDRALATSLDRATVDAFLASNVWARRVDALLAHADAIIQSRPFEKTLGDGAPRGASAGRPVLIFCGGPGPQAGVSAFLDLAGRVARSADVEIWIVSASAISDVEGRVVLGVADALGLATRLRWFPGLSPEAIARALAHAGETGGAYLALDPAASRAGIQAALLAGCLVAAPAGEPVFEGVDGSRERAYLARFPVEDAARAAEAVLALLHRAAEARQALLADRGRMVERHPPERAASTDLEQAGALPGKSR